MAHFARLASVPAFFALKIASAILLLKVCAAFLTVSGYGEFAQLVQFGTVLNLLAVGGTQNGLIRQSAAAVDKQQLAGIHGAALLIWAAASLLLIFLLCLANENVSSILVGKRDAGAAVVAIATLSLTSGPGQIWCSILSGRKRVTTSLSAQAAGLFASTGLALLFIARGQPYAAAIGFAAGPLLTLLIAGWAVAGLRLQLAGRAAATAQMLPLVRYSAAFAATSGYTALVLFGLRSVYRHGFGATALGYWIAANRISDMSTQLLGLFIIQFYVSHVAGLDDPVERRSFILRCWAAAAAVMTLGVLAFAMAGPFFVRLFLSTAFLPAVPVIRTYMIGDVFTVWSSLAMFTAFARGRPGRFAAIEIGTVSLMAAIALSLMVLGNARAPQLAYASAYAVTAAFVTIGFLFACGRSSRAPTARRRVSAA